MSLEEQKGVNFKEKENLLKCSEQILLSTKLKKNWSLGAKDKEKEEEGGKEKLISINR